MTMHFYSILYISVLAIICIPTLLEVLFRKDYEQTKLPAIHPIYVIGLCLFVISMIASIPIEEGSDKYNYNAMFIQKSAHRKDAGWNYYMDLCRFFFKDSTVFFIVTALLYFIGNYFFLKSIVPKNYFFYLLLTTFGSFGYFSYGVNTIRAGVGLSFLLLAILNRKDWKFILFAFLSVIMHKSMLIPLVAFILTKYFSNTKTFIKVWITSLMISILNISAITDFISNLFGDLDERVDSYAFSDFNELYSSGFRYDFIAYSVLPIFLGYYFIYKLEFKSEIYIRLFNMYLIANSFWLFLVRIPYTDRFAYLSWFLYPFILLYPLFTMEEIYNRRVKVALSMGGIILFNLLISII